jgi:tetratricopeptide (TPR) repeat protein
MSAAWLIVAAAATLADCDDLALRGATAAPACYRQVASSTADDGLRARALWRSGDVAGANAAFRLAVAVRPNDAALRASWGHLFLEVHQEADAQALFQEALEREGEQVDALLGMAELSLGRFEPGVKAYVDRVLAQDPREGRAHLLLDRMDLELGRIDDTRAMLQGLLDDGVL